MWASSPSAISYVQRKAVALRYKTELPFAFREGDIKAFLSAAGAFKQEFQRKRRLSGAGLPLDQIQPFRINTTAQDVVQPRNAGRNALLAIFGKVLLVHCGNSLLRLLRFLARKLPVQIARHFRAPISSAVGPSGDRTSPQQTDPEATENPHSPKA